MMSGSISNSYESNANPSAAIPQMTHWTGVSGEADRVGAAGLWARALALASSDGFSGGIGVNVQPDEIPGCE
jgi:hypothetical protein